MRRVLTVTLLCAFLAPAYSAQTYLATNPAAWRIENYAGSGNAVVLWFTGSPCANGNVSFPANATAADMNRLWVTVAVGKTTGKKMFLTYDNAKAPASCPLISFGLDSE